MELAAGLRRLSNRVSHFYVVEEGGKLTLVDAGKPSDWALLLRTLAAHQLSLSAIDCVLVTHAHGDHTGFAERARAEAEATVRVHESDAAVAMGAKLPRTEGGFTKHLVRGEAYRTLFGLMRGGGLRIVPVAEVVSFSDGERLDVPGRPRVVHVPGHTAGMSALFFEQQSWLCTGDALITRNPMTGRVGPQIMPASLNVSSGQALESLARIAELRADLVLPGHGEAWTQGAAAAVEAARVAGPS
jgi:glyoxylase-like metal-dependent hydrolase (beta-lactamase superfamily II)